jgi:hypothetical protein
MGLNENHCWHCFNLAQSLELLLEINVVTTSGLNGFLLYFDIGIVQRILPGWHNFKSPVEIYHSHVKFCRIGRISKVLGYVINFIFFSK